MERIPYSKLTLQERAIRRLYGGEKTFVSNGWGWDYHKGKRGYWRGGHGMKAEDVAELFNISVDEVKRVKAIETDWTRELIVDCIFEFWNTHGRWPKVSELGKKQHHLPGERAMRAVFLRQPGYTRAQELIAEDKRLTAEMAITTPNATVRRTAIENFGFDKLIKKKLAVKINEDDFGILWQIGKMKFIEVTNSTPEPDGSFAKYFLRVPPEIKTAQQGVAWTFGVPTDGEWQNFSIETAT